ncbi:GNAT family N-acetyltransferase [Nocardiopsis trehalosi]|uniref:GNAT family N-acetyltransferase n=1 Tax=Nocardiopsis trehalosi TaxID=109329 RepID=UPI000A061CDC|nr:GNAT family N-acetyltransferase [Nocardiopsis trehalosi]
MWEPAAPAFVHALPALLDIYTAAMSPPPDQLAGRRTIMEHHARNPGFRAVVALSSDGRTALGFAYGFHGGGGQWWHDVVTTELRSRDPEAADRWFADSFEVAEVHVRPEHQGRGIGRRLLRGVTAHRPERTAVLSTHTGPTVARRLYASYGFTDVLAEFRFPGSPDRPFAIMAAPLPLRGPGRRRSAGRSRAWLWTG